MATPDQKAALSTEDVGGVFRELFRDRVLASALVANLLVLAYAVRSEFDAGNLLLVYWVQSITFGMFHTARICLLKDFSSAGTRASEGWSTAEGRARGWESASLSEAKLRAASTFLVLWLVAHFVVIGPLGIMLSRESVAAANPGQVLQCVLLFTLQQAVALVFDVRGDRRQNPRVDVICWLPFARLAPLLLVIVMSVPFGPGVALLVILAAFKTVGDGVVQLVESRLRSTAADQAR